jgi:hypothetical protein
MSEPQKKKRGRKRKNDLYFGPEQEEAVVAYLASDDEYERNRIYNKHLRSALDQMVESIIRRYKLYPKDESSFQNIHNDTLSFLHTKLNKFEPEKNKKAYSYFGTICKHYLLGRMIKYTKKMKHDISYEDVYRNVEEQDDMKYYLEEIDTTPLSEFIREISDSIKVDLEEAKLNENEIKVGNAIVAILDNYNIMFDELETNNKFTKNLFLSYVRNITSLETKDIRVSMRKFKKLYFVIKDDKINEGLI